MTLEQAIEQTYIETCRIYTKWHCGSKNLTKIARDFDLACVFKSFLTTYLKVVAGNAVWKYRNDLKYLAFEILSVDQPLCIHAWHKIPSAEFHFPLLEEFKKQNAKEYKIFDLSLLEIEEKKTEELFTTNFTQIFEKLNNYQF